MSVLHKKHRGLRTPLTIDKLAKFDEIFRITTFLPCFDSDNPTRSWWYRIGSLTARPSVRR
jgi:hypothetical protein